MQKDEKADSEITRLASMAELRTKLEKAQKSGGKYFDPPRGEHTVSYWIDDKPALRTSKYDKEQMLVNVDALDGTKFEEGQKEWWVTTSSPLAMQLLDKCDEHGRGNAKVTRTGDKLEKRVEIVE